MESRVSCHGCSSLSQAERSADAASNKQLADRMVSECSGMVV
jgi:hypothetical protein